MTPMASSIWRPNPMSTVRSTGPSDFIQTNIVGTFALLNAARQHWEKLGAAAKVPFPLSACLDR